MFTRLSGNWELDNAFANSGNWGGARSRKTYFGWNASAEVRGAALRGVGGGRGASFGNLYFQDPVVQLFLRQLRERALPEPPRSLLLVRFVATVPQSRYSAASW